MRLIKEPKIFYRGYKKAREHGLFSLIYQDYPLLGQTALRERLMSYLLTYRSKVAKIDGLARRLVRLKEKQAAEEKEATVLRAYLQQPPAKDHAHKYEAMRRQPGYQSSMQYLKSYYKEIYDECNLPNSRVVWQANAKEGSQSMGHAS